MKKGSGIALTLSKKKATAKNPVVEGSNDSLAEKHMPTGEELEGLKTSYATVLKNSGSTILNEVTTYRVCESRSNYYVVKTLNQKKPSVAVMPKCLASSFGIALPFDQKDFSFEAITICKAQDFPIVSAKPELISLKEEFTFADSGRSFVAIVENVSGKYGVTLRFSNGLTKLIALKDVPQAEKVGDNYPLGKVVRVAINAKTGRLSLKKVVIDTTDSTAAKRDQTCLLQAFDKLSAYAID